MRETDQGKNVAAYRLNGRDGEILHLLTVKVHLMSFRQIADEFFGSDSANAARRLDTLTERGLLAEHRLNARTVPLVASPLASWQPGESVPNLPRLAYQLSKRWGLKQTRIHLIYLAGPKLVSLTGVKGKSRPKHPLQASHDLGLAATFLHMRRSRPSMADKWRGENALALAPTEGQIPDALILNESGEAELAIEFGGLYSAKRLDRFHRYCQRRSLAYELW